MISNLLPEIHATVFTKMLLDINSQLQENPSAIPVVNFLDPKFGSATVAQSIGEGGGVSRSPQPIRKHSQPHGSCKMDDYLAVRRCRENIKVGQQ